MCSLDPTCLSLMQYQYRCLFDGCRYAFCDENHLFQNLAYRYGALSIGLLLVPGTFNEVCTSLCLFRTRHIVTHETFFMNLLKLKYVYVYLYYEIN